MKNIMLILLSVFLLPMAASSQTKSIDKFIKKYKHLDGAHKVKLPGMLFNVGSKVGKKHADDEGQKKALELAKSIKKMKMMLVEDAHKIPRKEVKKLIKGMKSESFEELISIHSEGTRVNIMLRGDEESIENLMFMVSEEDQFMMMSIKLKLKYDDINDLIQLMQEDLEIELETPEDILPEDPADELIRA